MQPHLQKGKPIPLKSIMAEISGLAWPEAVTPKLAELGRLVDKYRFREAAAVAETLLAAASQE